MGYAHIKGIINSQTENNKQIYESTIHSNVYQQMALRSLSCHRSS